MGSLVGLMVAMLVNLDTTQILEMVKATEPGRVQAKILMACPRQE